MMSSFAKGIFSVSMGLVILVGHGDAADANDGFVLSVNGCPVDSEEFNWFMQQERAAVFQFVNTTYPLESGKDFWDQDCNGTTPREVLRKKTVEKIIREKIQQILFRELGLTDDIRYAVFLENLEKLNRQRQKAVDEGRVIYGPVQYSTLQYYGHWMATMQIQAKEKLRKEQFDVTEPKLRDYYTQNKERFKSSGSLTIETLAVHGEQGTNSQCSGIDTVADEIILKVRQGGTFEAVAQEYKGRKDPNVLFQRFEMIDDARLGELFPEESHFKQIHSLIPGQVIKLSGTQDRAWIIKCVSVTASDYLPYEQIRNLLEQRCVDTEYDRLIQKRIQDAHVEINQKTMDCIKIL